MAPNKFTEKALEALNAAQSKGARLSYQQVDVEALLEQDGGLAAAILSKADVPLEALKSRLEAELDRRPKGQRDHQRRRQEDRKVGLGCILVSWRETITWPLYIAPISSRGFTR